MTAVTDLPITTSIGIDINDATENASSINDLNHTYDLGTHFNGSMMVLNLLLAAIAIPLNLVVMTYYGPTIKKIVPFSYFTLSTSDLLTAISGLLHSVTFLCLMVLGPSDADVVFYIALTSYFITVVSFRVSAFVSMIIAVIRAINVVSPFAHIKRVAVAVAILLQCLFWLALLSVDSYYIWHKKMAGDDDEYTEANKADQDLEDFFLGVFYPPGVPKFVNQFTQIQVNAGCLFSMLYCGFSVTFPALLAGVATIITAVELLKPASFKETDPEKRGAAVTIALITALFVVCSMCSLFQPCFLDCSDVLTRGTSLSVENMLTYSFGYLPFFVSAALNPLIMVVRGKGLRSFVLNCGKSKKVSPAVVISVAGSCMGETQLTSATLIVKSPELDSEFRRRVNTDSPEKTELNSPEIQGNSRVSPSPKQLEEHL